MKHITWIDRIVYKIRRPFRILKNKIFIRMFKQYSYEISWYYPKAKEVYEWFSKELDFGKLTHETIDVTEDEI